MDNQTGVQRVMSTKEEKFNSFSVPLGLLDYINPICYCITMVTIIRHTRADMGQPYSTVFLIGAIISIFFGIRINPNNHIIQDDCNKETSFSILWTSRFWRRNVR